MFTSLSACTACNGMAAIKNDSKSFRPSLHMTRVTLAHLFILICNLCRLYDIFHRRQLVTGQSPFTLVFFCLRFQSHHPPSSTNMYNSCCSSRWPHFVTHATLDRKNGTRRVSTARACCFLQVHWYHWCLLGCNPVTSVGCRGEVSCQYDSRM